MSSVSATDAVQVGGGRQSDVLHPGGVPGGVPQPELWLRWRTPVAITAVVAALSGISLLVTPAVAFDPTAWIVWARELTQAGRSVNTYGGPDWKPLPFVLLVPVTAITRNPKADLYIWLFIARGGMFMAAALIGVLAHRMAGWWAAVPAVVLIAVSEWWFYDGILANSEPLMVALMAGAILAAVSDRNGIASALAVGASLVRPEIWPLFLLWGLWLLLRGPRRLWRLSGLVIACAVTVALWDLPGILSTGSSVIGAADGATGLDQARYAAFPLFTVFKQAFADSATPVVGLATLLALGLVGLETWRRWRGERSWRALLTPDLLTLVTLGAIIEVLVVGVMAQDGFDGSPKYSIPGIALGALAGAVALARLSQRWPIWAKALMTIVAAGAAFAFSFNTNRYEMIAVRQHSQQESQMMSEASAIRCPGRIWTYDANRAQLAELTDQSVYESGHPRWFNATAYTPPQWVFCAQPKPREGAAS